MEKEPKERRTEMLRDGEKDKTEKEMERGEMCRKIFILTGNRYRLKWMAMEKKREKRGT